MSARPRRWWRLLKRAALAGVGAVLVLLLVAVVDGWRAFGRAATGARLARMERSPHYRDGHFENPEPLRNDAWGSLVGALHASPDTSPKAAVQTVTPDLRTPPASGLRVTWLGHSSTLVEIDGRRILTDPVWSTRVSPVDLVGPRRWYPTPIPLEDLPPIDAVVISHDHYDHLDRPTSCVFVTAWSASWSRSGWARISSTGGSRSRASSSSTGGRRRPSVTT